MIQTPKWSPQRKITEHDIETSKAPALAVFNDNIYMVWRGRSSNSLWYSIFCNETEKWSKEEKINNNYTSSAPSLTEFKGKLYLAYKDKESDYLYYCIKESEKSPWSDPIKFNNKNIDARSGSGPSILSDKNELYLAWTGVSGSTLWYSRSDDGNNWDTQTNIFASPKYGPTLAFFKKELNVGYTYSTDDDIYFQSYKGSSIWSSPGKVGLEDRSPKTKGGPTLLGDNKFLYLMFRDYRSDRDNIWYMAYDGAKWRYLIDVGLANGAKTSQRIGIVNWKNKILMVWRGSNSNTLWQSYYDPSLIKSTEIYAHRGNVEGGNINHEENTRDAIQAAMDSGVDGVEFDVQEASDGFYIHHDKQSGSTIQGIQKNHPYVPTLDEILGLNWGNTKAIIELKKETVVNPVEILELVISKKVEKFLIMSFDLELIKRIAEHWKEDSDYAKNLSLGFLTASNKDIKGLELPTYSKEIGNKTYSVQWSVLMKYNLSTQEDIQHLVDCDYEIGVWTVNSQKDLESHFLNSWINIVITDKPGLVLNENFQDMWR
ncbi:MAG: hypothetical protein JXR05_09215 [Flavobacteriaceae bacterium]